jgi:large subunit ribosomal protein L17
MRGTPTKGKRFGGNSAHQKAMMGNLVASMIAAESIVTTEAKAKALPRVTASVPVATRAS